MPIYLSQPERMDLDKLEEMLIWTERMDDQVGDHITTVDDREVEVVEIAVVVLVRIMQGS